jgi:hypothetical protein
VLHKISKFGSHNKQQLVKLKRNGVYLMVYLLIHVVNYTYPR